MLKKTILSIVIFIILLSIIFCIIDYNRVKNYKAPIFVIKHNNKDTFEIAYYGLGYKIIRNPDTFYINAETIRKVLSHENLPKSNSYVHSLDLNKSLDDIDKDIINLVLSEEDFNQSKAAERLGIR
jgi:DNA-binding NtrC family response regulator